MEPGDIVRIKPSDRLTSPWKGYAINGAMMRVRRIATERQSKNVSVQPAELPPQSFRHEWFDAADLERWEERARPDLHELLKAYAKKNLD